MTVPGGLWQRHSQVDRRKPEQHQGNPQQVSKTDPEANAENFKSTIQGADYELAQTTTSIEVDDNGDGTVMLMIHTPTGTDLSADDANALRASVQDWYVSAGSPYGEVSNVALPAHG